MWVSVMMPLYTVVLTFIQTIRQGDQKLRYDDSASPRLPSVAEARTRNSLHTDKNGGRDSSAHAPTREVSNNVFEECTWMNEESFAEYHDFKTMQTKRRLPVGLEGWGMKDQHVTREAKRSRSDAKSAWKVLLPVCFQYL
ncbi:hypothetical protein DL96DRAFT_1615941 [Flagelloscypha sp. PMI_526]|nr:hypothetical protein DL96DRAFT_1615941 [Flagelloscypha sp. PMI_526]